MIDDLDDFVKENRKLKEELDTKESKEWHLKILMPK